MPAFRLRICGMCGGVAARIVGERLLLLSSTAYGSSLRKCIY